MSFTPDLPPGLPAPHLPQPQPAPPLTPRGLPVLAWLVILGGVGFLAVRTAMAPPGESPRTQAVLVGLQDRYLIGTSELFPTLKPELLKQARALDRGSFLRRLGGVMVANELAGPEEARNELHALREQLAAEGSGATEVEQALASLLERIYGREDPTRPVQLTEDERALLRQRLGWLGKLAAATAEVAESPARRELLAAARRTALVMLIGTGAALGLAAIGFLLLIVFLALWLARRLWLRLVIEGPGGVYAEAFAVWLALYFALGYASRWAHAGRATLLLQGVLMLLCAGLAILWAVWRGVPFARLRREIGLEVGPTPGREILFGVATWLAALPLLILGVLIMFGLMRLRQTVHGSPLSPGGTPTHPIAGELLEGGWAVRVQLLILAAVLAPLVEETMFRGFLYRHVRGGFGPLVSALVVSFLFAVIHPQGLLAVPALMGLAFAFSLVREWRGTLLPGMVAHGVNNGLVTVLLIAMGG